MKRLIVILIVLIVSMVFLAACGGAGTSTPTRGQWDGNTFTSSFFGLHLDIPDDWTAMTESEIQGAYQFFGVDAIAPGEAVTPEAFDNADHTSMIDMMAVAGEGGMVMVGDMQSMIALSINLLTSDEVNMNADQWLAHIMQEAGAPRRVGEDAVRIGSLDWYYVDSVIAGTTSMQRMFANIEGRFVRLITIGYQNETQLNQYMGFFRSY